MPRRRIWLLVLIPLAILAVVPLLVLALYILAGILPGSLPFSRDKLSR
jgi:hypothetical protein